MQCNFLALIKRITKKKRITEHSTSGKVSQLRRNSQKLAMNLHIKSKPIKNQVITYLWDNTKCLVCAHETVIPSEH